MEHPLALRKALHLHVFKKENCLKLAVSERSLVDESSPMF